MTSMYSLVCGCCWIWAHGFIDQLLHCTYILLILYCFPAVCLFPRMDWRVLPICRRCLLDETKRLFEWSHMCYYKSANILPRVHLQLPPRLHRWDFLIRFQLSSLCIYLSVSWQYASKYGSFCSNKPLWEGCSWGKKWQIDIWRKSDMVAV